MALPWVRLDTSIFDNPKFLVLRGAKRHRAIFVYVAAMAYSGKHETGGFVQREVLPLIDATAREMGHLCDVGLMNPVRGGWEINGWDGFQLTSDEIQKRREKAQNAAAARWSKSGRVVDLDARRETK